MFKLFGVDRPTGGVRLEADKQLMPADFRIIAEDLGTQCIPARKIGYVAASRASSHTQAREGCNIARPGDWIVTNMSPQRDVLRDDGGHFDRYVITAERFANLYAPARCTSQFGAICCAKGVVESISLSGGFDIVAPWGKRQTAPTGYVLCNSVEVYGIDPEIFAATYEVMPG